MGSDQAVYYMSQMIWNALFIAGPVLLATLVVGLLISIFQVTTQLQEITLSYVPKILVTAFLLIVLGPWMLNRLANFAVSLYQVVPTIG